MQIQPVPLRDELRTVSRPVLEEYVGARVKQFSRVLAGVLIPGVTEQAYEFAYARTLQLLGTPSQDTQATDSYTLRFTHRCRFLGCMRKECPMCKNNPNKKCREDDNFDECYADGQVLKSKCEADVYLELINLRTGATEAMPGVEIAVSVVDGDSYNESTAGNYSHIKELLKNDDDSILLSAYQAGSKTEADGRLYLRMNEGAVKLPDVCVTDKNDTFHMNNETFGTFRLMARAVRREGYGYLAPVENIRPAVSGRFIVKTQRALNDYRKSEYPHFKDELTKLKHIGSITAQRLREIQQHLDCPYGSIETVEQLKQLMLYADQNRQVENKMLELLNMKGKHKHKWDYLREVLAERVVYDDMLHRVWYTDDSMSQGVIFACKQGQVNMERPIGLAQRAPHGRLLVTGNATGQDAEMLKQWRSLAEAMWHTPGHRGWMMVQEQLEMASAGTGGTSLLIGGGPTLSMTPGGSISMADGIEDQMLARRGSVGMTSMMISDSARSRRSSAVSYHPGPNSPDRAVFGVQQTQQAAQQAGSNNFADGTGGLQQHAAFQFAGGRTLATQALINSGLAASDLLPDVYRTASAPNMAAASSPLFSQHSMDSPGAGAGLVGAASGPIGGVGTPGGPADLVLPPPPVRSGRYRRLSADAGAVRQIAMMQAAGIPQANTEFSPDMAGKRSRISAPGQQLLEELQLQQQQQQQLAGTLCIDAQISPVNRHALYHMESRGRHTPRSRLSQDIGDTVAAAALSGVLDASDLETYLAQNFSFVTGPGEPSLSGGVISGGDQRGMGSLGGGGMSLGGGVSPTGLSGPLMQMSMQPSDSLPGQMQHTLILNDPSSRLGVVGNSGGSGLLGLDGQNPQPHAHSQPLSQHLNHQQQQQSHQQQHQQQHSSFGIHLGGMGGSSGGNGAGVSGPPQFMRMDSGNMIFNQANRELKRCESDSFKRFLAVGLPFSPMEATPEDLFEGLRRDSGFMGD